VVLTHNNDEENDEHGWNRRENKKNWSLYLLVGSLCIILAWLLGGTG